MYNYGVTALPVSQYIIMAYKGNWSCADWVWLHCNPFEYRRSAYMQKRSVPNTQCRRRCNSAQCTQLGSLCILQTFRVYISNLYKYKSSILMFVFWSCRTCIVWYLLDMCFVWSMCSRLMSLLAGPTADTPSKHMLMYLQHTSVRHWTRWPRYLGGSRFILCNSTIERRM
jgi:hypothetical protein